MHLFMKNEPKLFPTPALLTRFYELLPRIYAPTISPSISHSRFFPLGQSESLNTFEYPEIRENVAQVVGITILALREATFVR